MKARHATMVYEFTEVVEQKVLMQVDRLLI